METLRQENKRQTGTKHSKANMSDWRWAGGGERGAGKSLAVSGGGAE